MNSCADEMQIIKCLNIFAEPLVILTAIVGRGYNYNMTNK